MNSATTAALTRTYLEFYASCPEGFEAALDAELPRASAFARRAA